MRAAIKQNCRALELAGDELLADPKFEAEAKRNYYILKIGLISGRYTCVVAKGDEYTFDVLQECGKRLGLHLRGGEQLLHGTVHVLVRRVSEWPGIRRAGEVAEYSLVR